MFASAPIRLTLRLFLTAFLVFALCATAAAASRTESKYRDANLGAARSVHQRHVVTHPRRFRMRTTTSKVRVQLSAATLSPVDGQTVSGPITWQVEVFGAIPSRVDFAMDSTVKWSQASSPYLYGGVANGLDTTQLSNGPHVLTATAYGSKGAKSSTTVTVTVANVTTTSTSTDPTSTTSPTTTSTPTDPAPTTSAAPSSIYWGAWIGNQLTGGQAPWDMTAVSTFEQLAAKKLSVVHFAAPFANCASQPCSFYSFPTGPMENVRDHGAIPFFSWSSQSIPSSLNEPNFQLGDVIDGTYDSYIRSFASAAKAWGHPFFLRFNWEMNGKWFPWSEGVNGNTAGQYVAAWRHMHDIFASVGATNATWVWCPNVDPNNQFQSLSSLYPGNSYVDWTCLDGYNWGTNPTKPGGWQTFDQLYQTTYNQIVGTIAPGKPMFVGETSSSEYGGSKADWITDALTKIPTQYPQIRGLLWFEKTDSGMDWPIETSTSSISAFAQGIQNPAYTTNDYANFSSTGPIQPPS